MKTRTWIEKADDALMRASQSARDLSRRTHTPFIVMIDGKIVKLKVHDEEPVVSKNQMHSKGRKRV